MNNFIQQDDGLKIFKLFILFLILFEKLVEFIHDFFTFVAPQIITKV